MQIGRSHTYTQPCLMRTYEAATRAVQRAAAPWRPTPAVSITSPVALPLEKRSSQLQAHRAQRSAAAMICEQRHDGEGEIFCQCGHLGGQDQGCSRERGSGFKSSATCVSESIARPASSACENSSSVHEHKDKIDTCQSNDGIGARENRKTPRGKKNGGLAWWSRRQLEARILAAFKD